MPRYSVSCQHCIGSFIAVSDDPAKAAVMHAQFELEESDYKFHRFPLFVQIRDLDTGIRFAPMEVKARVEVKFEAALV